MFGFARTGVLLLISFTLINNCYSLRVEDSIEEDFQAGNLVSSRTLSNKYSFTNFRIENGKENSTVGFSVSPIRIFNPKNFYGCSLEEEHLEPYNRVVFFLMDFVNEQIQINCSKKWNYLWIYETEYSKKPERTSETTFKPLTMRKVKTDDTYSYYDFQFYIKLGAPDKALFFHNCNGDKVSYDLEYELVPTSDDFPPRSNIEPSYNVTFIVMCSVISGYFLILGLYRVYIYKKSQITFKNFHYVLLITIFLQALLYLFMTIEVSLTDINSDYPETDYIDPFIYVTKGLIFCCIVTLVVQGWIYVQNIFGRKEKYFVMSILIVQSVLRMTVYILDETEQNGNLFLVLKKYELYFVPVVLIYFLIRRADWKDKTGKKLKKLQLFIFIYLLTAFVFYFADYLSLIETTYFLKVIYYIVYTICFILFYAILSYKVQPKFISEISALKTQEGVLQLSAKY